MFYNISLLFKWLAKGISIFLLLIITYFAMDSLTSENPLIKLNSKNLTFVLSISVMVIGLLIAFGAEFTGSLFIIAGYVWLMTITGKYEFIKLLGLFPLTIVFYAIAGFFNFVSKKSGRSIIREDILA